MRWLHSNEVQAAEIKKWMPEKDSFMNVLSAQDRENGPGKGASKWRVSFHA